MEDDHMMNVPWETSSIHELDLTSTELSAQCLESILLRMPGFTYLALGYCEFFNDKVRQIGGSVSSEPHQRHDYHQIPIMVSSIIGLLSLGLLGWWFEQNTPLKVLSKERIALLRESPQFSAELFIERSEST